MSLQLSKDKNYPSVEFAELIKTKFLKNSVNAGNLQKFDNCSMKIGDFSGREVGAEFVDKNGKPSTFWESGFFEDGAGRLKAYLLTTSNCKKFDDAHEKKDFKKEDKIGKIIGAENVLFSTEQEKKMQDSLEESSLIPSKLPMRVRREELTLGDLVGDIEIIDRDDLSTGRKLGAGGQATVFHGTWRKSEVAIKCFDKNNESYLGIREVILLSKIKHPGIIKPMAIAEGVTQTGAIFESNSPMFFDITSNRIRNLFDIKLNRAQIEFEIVIFY